MKKILFITIFCLSFSSVAFGLCGIENCHGLEIQCGPNVAEVCTASYAFGDRCRRFAKCGIKDGKCQFLESEEFKICKACVKRCEKKHKNDIGEAFACEGGCEK